MSALPQGRTTSIIFGGVARCHYGLITVGSSFFVGATLAAFPVTLNFPVWYAGTGMFPLLFLLALAVLAFYTLLGRQQVFEGKLLEE